MNVTQLLAWVMCLALAFFASLVAVRNAAKTAVLEKQFAAVQVAAVDQTTALRGIDATLRRLGVDLKAGSGPAGGAGQPGVEELSQQVQQLRERVDALEGRNIAPQPDAPVQAAPAEPAPQGAR